MKFQNVSIENVDPKVREAIQKNYTKDDTSGTPSLKKGVVLYGPTGVGKTYALKSIVRRAQEIGLKVHFENWVELLLELKDFSRNTLDNITSEDLAIDDLGAEKQTEWSQEKLYLIVNRCYEREHNLFIATNLTLEEFQTKYGDRIFSRLGEMCEFIEMTGEDRRV